MSHRLAPVTFFGLASVFATWLAGEGAIGFLAGLVIAGSVLLVCLVAAGLISPAQGLLVAAFLLPMNDQRPAGVGAIGDIALLISGLCLAPLSGMKLRVPSIVWVLAGMSIVFISGLVGSVFTQNWSEVPQAARFFFGGPVVVILVALLVQSRRQALQVMVAYTAGVLVSVFAASIEEHPNGRVTGLAFAAADLAISSLFAMSLLLGVFLARPWGLVKIVAGLGATFCAYGVLLSGGRSGVVGLAMLLITAAWASRAKGALLSAVAIPLGALGLLYIAPLLPNGDTVQRAFGLGRFGGSLSTSDDEHLETARGAWEVISGHWATGVGFGPANSLNAHSMILTVAATGGLLALIGLGIVLWPYLEGFLRALRNAYADPVAVCLSVGGLAFVQVAQLHPQLWDRYIWFWMTLLLIVLAEPITRQRPHGLSAGDRPDVHIFSASSPGRVSPPYSGDVTEQGLPWKD